MYDDENIYCKIHIILMKKKMFFVPQNLTSQFSLIDITETIAKILYIPIDQWWLQPTFE